MSLRAWASMPARFSTCPSAVTRHCRLELSYCELYAIAKSSQLSREVMITASSVANDMLDGRRKRAS